VLICGHAAAEADPWGAVGGLDKEITEIKHAVEMPLLFWSDFARYGLKPTRGVLVHGPPGVGKSTLLRAVGRHFGQHGVHVMVSRGHGQLRWAGLVLTVAWFGSGGDRP
jgi:ATP-dependent 26S proteasome regulatory subunit